MIALVLLRYTRMTSASLATNAIATLVSSISPGQSLDQGIVYDIRRMNGMVSHASSSTCDDTGRAALVFKGVESIRKA
jgi:hypothetical protein